MDINYKEEQAKLANMLARIRKQKELELQHNKSKTEDKFQKTIDGMMEVISQKKPDKK